MWDTAAGNHGFDARGPHEPAVLVVVVAPVRNRHLGLSTRTSDAPGNGDTLFNRGMSWVTSLRLPPVSDTARGMPCASVRTWCLPPGRVRSIGPGPLWAPTGSPDVGGVDHR
ncbi:hypothetical protein GCM10010211_76010 [Streptomyces albospinus]|uniref:Uncharacterized protein n=1 Tax=Streptomyces albospinus TaxID=285515 RepID=A0ABQ2VLU1_9ACTN|nr:hypothetical protein GCM10010211_76010 [Streptomyces albospinus]